MFNSANRRSFFKRKPTKDAPYHEKAKRDLKHFIVDLLDKLKDVYREEDMKVIETTSHLTDWTGLAMRSKERSVPTIYALEKDRFVRNCQNVCRSVKGFDKCFKVNFRLF